MSNANGHQAPADEENIITLKGMYEDYFLDYASYVILERAIPAVYDGFKPVQRRIMHAMKEMDDGRYNKVANIIGSAMQYHPHGDASIGDAIVNLGQKDLLIDTQGNWGDVRTGDSAAAPRYIEARLSKFALEVVFNPQTTEWQLSYDGRKKEPVTFPVKFPLLIAQGVEGIAVGLSTKMLPHNFCEILQGCIAILKGKKVKLFPDFLTGGKIDVTDYNDGKRGGKVRVRAAIEEVDKSTLAIRDIPYGTTTTSLIESIVKANDKGKIKVKQVVDNTAKDIEILVNLAPGTSPDITMDALYAFTDCEVSISPNACVIVDDKPQFLGISDILQQSVDQTVDLLRKELEIEKAELKEKIFFSDLLKIFINEGMYKHPDYENSGDLQKCYEVLNELFTPFFDQFYREIENEDYKHLIDKPLSSITRFDTSKVEAQIKELQEKIEKVDYNLDHLTDFA
ncbi:MAG: DNA gyrase/topoisomerase IV subunit A, partial [Bacteroidota bacterium]